MAQAHALRLVVVASQEWIQVALPIVDAWIGGLRGARVLLLQQVMSQIMQIVLFLWNLRNRYELEMFFGCRCHFWVR